MGTLLRLAALIITLIGAQEASAQTADEFAVGHGVVCSTAKQIGRYLTLYKETSSPIKAIQAVNSEAKNPGACGITSIVFISRNIIGSVEVSGGVMRLIQIVVLAKKTEHGWVRVTPTEQYTAVFVTLDEVREAATL